MNIVNTANAFDLKCLSLNVRGLNKSIKRRTIFRWLHKQNHQVIFLQESYCSKDLAPVWENEWGGKAFFSHGTNHSKGVITLINPSLNFKVEKVIPDKQGRFIILKLSLEENVIVLVNIYAPNDVAQQVAFFKSLNQQLEEFAQDTIVIGGDFNCALTSNDKRGGKPVSKKSAVIQEINTLCDLYNLSDIWRNLNKEKQCYTWRTKSFKIQCRLDFFLVSRGLIRLAKKCDIVHAPESDHSAVSLVLQSDHLNQKRGPGFWKFNTALLKDEAYITALKINIPIFKEKYNETHDLGLKWDLIKMEIRGFTIKYSKRKAKKYRDEEKLLNKKINDLQARAENNPHNRHIILELQSARSRLKKIMLTKTKGAITRSKVRWHEEGERNTKYFFSLEKRHHDVKTVSKLKVGENYYIEDQFEILEEEKKFYESLYRSTNINPKNFKNSPFFNPENVTALSEEEKKSCEGLVNEEECMNALKDFNNNKTPGTDGLPAEFYRFFWPDICHDLLASYNFASQHGMLSISQRRGIISLIPKKSKDKTILENLRPISLLNVDYKILTKVIAKRIEKVLPTLINPGQTGYVKGRYIGENVRLIYDLIHYTDKLNQKGINIFLDFKKAFDSIEWNYLLEALQLFNFGHDIQNWIKIFYNNVTSCVLNNGHASNFFSLQWGVRQGCPLSGILFVLGIELLSRSIKNDPTIRGMRVNKHELKISQYADDTTVFVRDLDSVTSLLRVLNDFKEYSGLEINTAKMEAMWLGEWKDRTDEPFGFKWPKEPINALGIFFSYNQECANRLNFGEKILNLEKTLNTWQRRNLTLYGKINIVKTLGISKLIYSASVLPVPDHYIQEINKLIFNFIWAGKPPKIKRNTIIGEKKDGGLKMCDFKIMEKALKITWVNRIQDESQAPWKIIPNQLLHKHGSLAFLTNCNFAASMLDLDDKLPTFYKKMLDYWSEFKIATGIDSKTNPNNEIVWNNRKILVGKKPVFYQNWYDAGITKISDILNQNQDFLKWHDFALKFNLNVPFTTYHGLVNAIPKHWKACLKNPAPIVTNNTTVNTLRTSSIYSSLLNNIFVPPTAETKILRHGFTEKNIQKVYLMPFAVTNDVKIIMFQYKVIHNVLPTHATLNRDGTSESPICNLCNAEEQTLHHLLINCTLTVDFWILFQEWWYQKTKETITLSISHILYGWHDRTKHWQVLNYCLLIAKYCIFCTSLRGDVLDFKNFLLVIPGKLEILKEIATAKKALPKFHRTWAFLL